MAAEGLGHGTMAVERLAGLGLAAWGGGGGGGSGGSSRVKSGSGGVRSGVRASPGSEAPSTSSARVLLGLLKLLVAGSSGHWADDNARASGTVRDFL